MLKRLRKSIQDVGASPTRTNAANTNTLTSGSQSEKDAASGFICPMCMAGFKSPDELQIHFDKAHANPFDQQEVATLATQNNTSRDMEKPDKATTNGTQSKFVSAKSKVMNTEALHAVSVKTEKGNANDHSIALTDGPKPMDSASPASRTRDKNGGDDDHILQQEISDLASSLQEEKWYAEELKAELEKMKTEHESQREKLVLLEQQMSISVKTNEDLAREKEVVTNKLAIKSQESARLQSVCDELKSEKLAQVEVNQNQSVELEKAAAWIRDLESQLVQRPGADDVMVLKKELVSVQTLMDQLTMDSEKQKEAVKMECKKLEQKADAVTKKYNSLKTEYDQLVVEQQSSKTAIAQSVQEKAAATIKLSEEHSAQTEKLQEELSNLQSLLEKEQLHSQSLEIENNNLQEKYMTKYTQVEKTDADLKKMSQEFSRSKLNCENMKQQLQELSAHKMQLQERLKGALMQVEKTSKEKDTTVTEKDTRIESLTHQYEDLCGEHEETKRELGDLLSQKNTAQDELVKLREMLHQMELEKSLANQKYSSSVAQFELLLSQSKENGIQLQNRIHELEAEVKAAWDKAQEDRSSNQVALLDSEKQLMQMHLTMEKLQDEVTHYKSLLEEEQLKTDSFKSTSSDMTDKLKLLNSENLINIERMQTLERNLTETNSKLTSEISGKEAAIEEVKRLQQERKDLMEKMEVGEGQAELVLQLKDENDSLRKRLDDNDSRHRAQIVEHEVVLKEYEEKLMECKTNIRDLEQSRDASQLDIINLEKMVASLKEKEEQSTADVGSKCGQIIELQQDLAERKVNHDAEISALQRLVEDKSRECEKMSAAFEAHKASNVNAFEKLEESRLTLQDRISQLQEETTITAMKLKESEELVLQRTQDMQKLDVVVANLKQHNRQETELLKTRHAEKVSSMGSQLKSLQDQQISTKSELDTLRLRKVEADAEIANVNRQLGAAEAEMKESSLTISNLNSDITGIKLQLENSLSELTKFRAEWSNEKTDLETKHSVVMKELIAKHNTEIEELVKNRKTSEDNHFSEMGKLKEKIEADNLLLEAQNCKTVELEKSLAEVKEEFHHMQEKMNAEKGELSEMVKSMTEKSNDLETHFEHLKSENRDILMKLASKEELSNSLELTISKLQEDLKKKDGSLKQALAELGRTSDASKRTAELLENTSVLLAESQAKAEHASKEVTTVERINSELKSSLDVSNNTIDNLTEDLASTKNKLSDVESALSEKLTELGVLNATLMSKDEEMNISIQSLHLEINRTKTELQEQTTSLKEEKQLRKEEKKSWESTKLEMEDSWSFKQSEWIREREELLQSQETLKGAQQILINGKMELQKQLEKTKQEVEDEKLKLQDLESLYSSQQKSNDEKIKQINIDLEKSHESLKAIQDEKQNIEARLQLEVGTLRDNLDSVRGEWQMGMQQVETLNAESDELKGQIVVLQATVQNNADERRALLERCIIAEQGVEQLQANELQLKRRLDDAQAAMHELGRENQAMQVKHTTVLSRQWTDDKSATECGSCHRPFSITLRKHHCRHCGLIFCADCSSRTSTVASSKKPVRVCEKCYDDLLTVQ